MFWLFVLAFVVFTIYSWWKFYDQTDPTQSKVKRIWGAMTLAAASLFALVTGWWQGWMTP